jgi:hypothetical protein
LIDDRVSSHFIKAQQLVKAGWTACARLGSVGSMTSLDGETRGFEATLHRLLALFESASEAVVGVQLRPGDWSVKQIACHLIDSASNNHQRFTRLQRTARLEFPPYEPEPWVGPPSTMAFSHGCRARHEAADLGRSRPPFRCEMRQPHVEAVLG